MSVLWGVSTASKTIAKLKDPIINKNYINLFNKPSSEDHVVGCIIFTLFVFSVFLQITILIIFSSLCLMILLFVKLCGEISPLDKYEFQSKFLFNPPNEQIDYFKAILCENFKIDDLKDLSSKQWEGRISKVEENDVNVRIFPHSIICNGMDVSLIKLPKNEKQNFVVHSLIKFSGVININKKTNDLLIENLEINSQAIEVRDPMIKPEKIQDPFLELPKLKRIWELMYNKQPNLV